MSAKNETEAVKTSVTMTDVKDMLARTLTGEIWGEDPADIKAYRDAFGKFVETIKVVAKSFDEGLIAQRQAHGADHLKDVAFFRKPREAKEGKNILDSLNDLF